jgi:phage gp36-like protein
MGNYISAALLEERIGSTLYSQLVNITDSTAKAAFIANCIERAEAMVDSYLAAKYIVPVAANAMVEEIALTIAERELYKRSDFPDLPEKIKDNYKDALSALKDLSNGKARMPVSGVPVSAGGTAYVIESDESAYSSMDGY